MLHEFILCLRGWDRIPFESSPSQETNSEISRVRQHNQRSLWTKPTVTGRWRCVINYVDFYLNVLLHWRKQLRKCTDRFKLCLKIHLRGRTSRIVCLQDELFHQYQEQFEEEHTTMLFCRCDFDVSPNETPKVNCN